MNRAPKKPCAHVACPALVEERFCAAHKAKRYREQNARRGSASSQGYGAQWRKLVAIQREREPLCREHLKRGEAVQKDEVDHIVPKALGGIDDFSNFQSLCKSCHSAKTAREVLHR